MREKECVGLSQVTVLKIIFYNINIGIKRKSGGCIHTIFASILPYYNYNLDWFID